MFGFSSLSLYLCLSEYIEFSSVCDFIPDMDIMFPLFKDTCQGEG